MFIRVNNNKRLIPVRPEKNHRGWRWPSTTKWWEYMCLLFFIPVYHLFHKLKILKSKKRPISRHIILSVWKFFRKEVLKASREKKKNRSRITMTSDLLKHNEYNGIMASKFWRKIIWKLQCYKLLNYYSGS